MPISAHDYTAYAELWTSFVDGNDDAFSELYRKTYKNLYAYGLTFGIYEEQVRDIIQDLFVKLYTKPDIIKETGTLIAFLFRAMRNSCITELKNQQKLSALDDVEAFELNYSLHENLIESKEQEEYIHAVIHKILSQITPRQKEIIYLRFLHQLEYAEISQIMNMSEQAARNLLHRAMDKIRKDNPESDLILFLLVIILMR